jgi:hypothetical protein
MPRRRRRSVLIVLSTLVLVYLLLSAAMFAAMRQPPEIFGSIMARVPAPAMMLFPFPPLWKAARAGSLQPGDEAPDFDLPTYDHSARVRLSTFRGARPVVLVFGSYT